MSLAGKPALFDCVTIFPEMFAALTGAGIPRKALEEGRWCFRAWNPRDFSGFTARSVDDRPYGGGPGMVMRPGPLEAVIRAAQARQAEEGRPSRVICLSPQGALLTHQRVMELTRQAEAGTGFILLCGRYEGIDERLIARMVEEEISVGDFVLSGGELPAMTLMDAVIRQLPGVLGDAASASEDSFVAGLLDCPHYTRPEEYQGQRVPEVLLSGNHASIRRWRLKAALARTRERRPDLLRNRALSAEETQLLAEILREEAHGKEQCGEH
ncbi:MAG: tRNA (guanosine(37)-N1)-methyltransferase TrmD [Zoogloeaceae bacterium]|jgi:tRNA (guanine37-N1)-methyltransferase|nr:tRNA (guanosine(37)-N1)-methyltransferase TrmD [Zoogloeaceae bacterium]